MTPRQTQAQNEGEITGAAAAAAAAISQLEAKLETLTLALEQERSRNRTENTAAAAEQTDAEHAQQHTPRQPKNESQSRTGNEPIQATQGGAPHPDHNSEGEKRSENDNENESKSEKGNANGNENARVMRSGQDAQPVKPSQMTMRRDQAKSPATDLSFLRQSRIGTERCEMDSAFEILTAAYNLEEPLRCLKLGINGLWDFHSHFNKTYPDTAEIIGDSDEANLLRRNIGKYFFKVLGRQECGMDTAALTTMIHASRTRGDLKMITQQVAMYGADKDNSTMNALAVQAATTLRGSTPHAALIPCASGGCENTPQN